MPALGLQPVGLPKPAAEGAPTVPFSKENSLHPQRVPLTLKIQCKYVMTNFDPLHLSKSGGTVFAPPVAVISVEEEVGTHCIMHH